MLGIFNFIAGQAQHPRGFWGKLVARMMTRMTASQTRWAVERLAPAPEDSVLEIGFGTGVGIGELAQRVTDGRVTGVEVSTAMIEVASKKNAQAIAAGKVRLMHHDGGTLPLKDGEFDRVCTVNTMYVIERPGDLFEEMHRVLKPGGKAVIVFPVREEFARFRPARAKGMHLHELDEIKSAFESAGFGDVQLDKNAAFKFGANCLSGTKSSAS